MKTLLLSICLLLLNYLPSNAEITVTIGSVNAVPGEKVDIPIILTGANGSSAFWGLDLKIQYDTNSVSVEGGEFIPSCPELPENNWIINLNYPNNTNNTILLVYCHNTLENVVVPNNTVIGYLTVKYKATSPSMMTFDTVNSMVFNNQEEYLDMNLIGGLITVSGSTMPALIFPFDNDSSNYQRTNFWWTKISETVNFRIQVATNNEFSNLILDELVVENRKNLINLPINRNYYWRVKALKVSDSSDWSQVRTFKTFISPPSLISPSNNNDGVLLNSTLTWTEDNPNNSYRVQIALTDKFTNLVTNEVVTDNTMLLSNLSKRTKYYWRVCSIIGIDSSAWSEVWKFDTGYYPPTLFYPQNSFDNILTEIPTLTWYSDIRTPESYQLQISLDSTFSQLKIDEAKIRPQYNSRSEYKFYGIENEKNYYWRVRSIYPNDTSDWSEIWRFRSGEVRETPTLIAPEKFANGVSTNYVDFSWYEIENAKYYKFRLYSYSTGESCNITENAYFSAWSLLDGTKYYWSVKAYHENYYNGKYNLDSSDWSEERSFTTGYFHPTVPVLSEPSNNQTQVSLAPQLFWRQSASTVIYRVHVSLNDRFDSQLIADTLVLATHLTLSNLPMFTKYYWRVKALDYSDSSDWSATWNFTTENNAPPITVLISPLQLDRELPLNTVLKWKKTRKAVKYRVQVSANNDMALPVLDLMLSDTVLQLNNVQKNTKYYWRVQSESNTDTSVWSDIWSFTTGNNIPSNPELILPLPLDRDIPTNPELIWWRVPEAIEYRVLVSINNDMSSPVIDQIVSDTLLQLNDLQKNTKYYWRLQSQSSTDTSAWSYIWSFTTGNTSDVATSNNATFSISPQPVRDEAIITYNVENGNARISIELYDLKGSIVATFNFSSLSEGTNELRLEVSNLPIGMYNAVIRNGAEVHTAKLIKVD